MTNTGPTAPDEHGVVMDVTHARQGRRGKHVLWILVISLVLVVAALFGTWASQASKLEDADQKSDSHAQSTPFQSPEPVARETR